MRHTTPPWQHDCDRCRYLGQTIGGGRIVDLYVHDESDPPTLIARFGSNGPDYLSTPAGYARASGHSELLAAAHLWRELETV
jgi:hypothetical protein